METLRPQLIILADSASAFCPLFGISMIERLLRVVERLGFREAVVLSKSNDVEQHLAAPSWARANVALRFHRTATDDLRVKELLADNRHTLLVSAGFYYDARLLKSLSERLTTALLIDSAPPPDCLRLWQSEGSGSPKVDRVEVNPAAGHFAAALLNRDWLLQQAPETLVLETLCSDAAKGRIGNCDAAEQPTYVVALRKHVRPVFFPAPSPSLTGVAERFPRDIAQNGVLDLPGFLDSPIEDWIVARLCRTPVTPNQITFVTMLIGLTVTVLFVTGHLWLGVALAYAIEVLDGVDGKLARTKVETTATGKWEHVVDYCVELSWWTALAYHFHGCGVPSAYWLLLLLVGSDLIDRLAKRVVKKKVGRNLDDVAKFDRFVRWIGSRRNINIWILILALILGAGASGFVLFCWWTAITAAAHVVRAFQIRLAHPL